MDSYVFYCPKCKQTFAGEGYQAGEKPQCPNCDAKTMATGVSKTAWVDTPKEEREMILNKLNQEAAAAAKEEEERKKVQAQRSAYAKSIGVSYEKSSGKSSESSWYSNIGKKIKTLAVVTCIVEIILALFGGMVMFFATAIDGNFMGVFIALISMVIAPFVAWVSSFMMYGFGELIDKTAANERNTRNMLELMLENNVQNKKEQ